MRIKGHVYVFNRHVFVQNPLQASGCWLKMHICVLLVACPYCKAKPLELCEHIDSLLPGAKNQHRWRRNRFLTSEQHHQRRKAAHGLGIPDIVVHPNGLEIDVG